MIFNCKNVKDISKIWDHPRVFGWIADDLSAKDTLPIINDAILYLMNEEKTGVIMVAPMNGITCQVHTAALPELWGRCSEFVRECIEWGFANTRYLKIVTFVPVFNKLAIRLTKKAGFQREGLMEKSFLKNWKIHDQELWGLTKEQYFAKKGGK